MKLVTASLMRQLDQAAITQRGIDAYSLMDAAGLAVARTVANNFEKGSVVILCGKGNNGGDGFVAARYLKKNGWRVIVVAVAPPKELLGDAARAFKEMPPGIELLIVNGVPDLSPIMNEADVIVDALLGTGFGRELTAPYDVIVEAANASGAPIVAVDIPSGLNPDTGAATLCIKAARTVTIGLPKRGFMMGVGPEVCGITSVESLQFPKDLLAEVSSQEATLTLSEAATLLPEREADSHKGTHGTVLIVGGCESMPGAARLAAMGAIRSGVGLVRLHAIPSVRTQIMHALPEVLAGVRLPETTELEPVTAEVMEQQLKDVDAIVVGPGMGMGQKTGQFLEQLLRARNVPVVLDADALNILAARPLLRSLLRPDDVLTPHPGELARLMDIRTSVVQIDRWKAVTTARDYFNCKVVLKGRGTLVAGPSRDTMYIPTGNSALARGGSGDVLAGIIGGLVAQKMSAYKAACLGVFVHGVAADIHTEKLSVRGARITEIADRLPEAWRVLEQAGGGGNPLG